jgi:hypothetical protein
MIFGGTKYRSELAGIRRILGFLVELDKKRKMVRVADARVDKIEDELRMRCPDPKFNDQHLLAIVIVSHCHVVCTVDDVAISYLKRADLFHSYKVKRPKIYKSQRNRNLCCDLNLT